MIDVERQLEDYGTFHDQEWGPITSEDILAGTIPTSFFETRSSRIPLSTSRRVAVAAAVATIALIGIIPMLLDGDDVSPADPVVPTTIAEETVPTTVVESPATSLAPTPSIGVVDVSSLLWRHAEVEGSQDGFMRDVSSGTPGFVAAGQALADGRRVAAVWFSENGEQWSRGFGDGEVFPAPSRVNAVAYGPEGYVAVGTNGDIAAMWYSGDGKVWSRLPHNPGFEEDGGRVSIEGVVHGSSGWVAVGWEDPGPKAVIWTSSDGRAWVRAPHVALLDDSQAEDVTYGSGMFVAVGSAAWVSDDGQTWLRSEIPSEDRAELKVNSVAYGNDQFVAVGSGFWLSSDGLSWTQATTSELSASDVFNGVAWGGDGFIAAGNREMESTATVITAFSIDALSWTAFDGSGFEGDESRAGAVVFGQERFIAVGGQVSEGIGSAAAAVGANQSPQ